MEVIERDCPICKSDVTHSFGRRGHMYVREYQDLGTFPSPLVEQCIQCDLVYLNPVMTDEEYKRFYDNDQQKKFVTSIAGETGVKYQAKISRDDKRRAKLVNKYVHPNLKLLDVGTGYSNFVGLIDGAIGVDISEARVRSAQERGLDVRLCNISDWKEEVDTVTLFHVLEHIPEPAPFLHHIYDVLGHNGRLIVEVPNLNDALVGLEKYKSFYFQNAHCSYFTPKSLTKLLNNERFLVEKEIRLQRYSFDNHLYWLLRGKPGKFKSLSFMNAAYSAFLKTIRKHDTIFLVCNKG